ncbi:hypothetical protein OUZ56_025552 [Daphnia magna]|uniref:Uncharacterized protein n=1 Tax=Daphnia magna TaxID=35525 RepID=A0ABQ9ZK66_9CRUS|nr:hypothetical protein OUZ56_025552 [Daphnia magna]
MSRCSMDKSGVDLLAMTKSKEDWHKSCSVNPIAAIASCPATLPSAPGRALPIEWWGAAEAMVGLNVVNFNMTDLRFCATTSTVRATTIESAAAGPATVTRTAFALVTGKNYPACRMNDMSDRWLCTLFHFGALSDHTLRIPFHVNDPSSLAW